MTQPAQRAATRAVAALVLLGVAAVLLVALVPWPTGDGVVQHPDDSGLRERAARECGVDPDQLYDEQDEGFAVFWRWTDRWGVQHRASLSSPGGVVSCG